MGDVQTFLRVEIQVTNGLLISNNHIMSSDIP